MSETAIPGRTGRMPLRSAQMDHTHVPPHDPVHAEERRVRKRKGSAVIDPFEIDAAKIPEGWTYEWKRAYTLGQFDHIYQLSLKENGWTEVPVSRHPELMPPGHTGAIEREGLILMERPTYLTQEARDEERMLAKQQVRDKEAQLSATPKDTMDRTQPKIGRSYEAIEVSDD